MKNVAVATAATVAVGLLAAPFAAADEDSAPTTTTIGQQGKLVNGNVVQSWTISGLKPSSDVIPYAPHGTLWEATATDEAVQGSVQPIVSNLNARSADGENYRVLFGVATEQGINPGALAQGEKTTGKVYFDVTGASPDSVAYNAGGRDLLVWHPAPPAPVNTGGGSASSSGGSAQRSPSQTAPAATAAAPAAGTAAGTPAAAGSAGTPAATGSTGTPAAAEGTPAATGSTGTPAATSAGTPAPAAAGTAAAPATGSQGTPAAAGAEGTPAPADSAGTAAAPTTGGQGTPAGAQAAAAPAADQVATAPAASQGTPVLIEETPVVGVPHGPGSTHPAS